MRFNKITNLTLLSGTGSYLFAAKLFIRRLSRKVVICMNLNLKFNMKASMSEYRKMNELQMKLKNLSLTTFLFSH